MRGRAGEGCGWEGTARRICPLKAGDAPAIGDERYKRYGRHRNAIVARLVLVLVLAGVGNAVGRNSTLYDPDERCAVSVHRNCRDALAGDDLGGLVAQKGRCTRRMVDRVDDGRDRVRGRDCGGYLPARRIVEAKPSRVTQGRVILIAYSTPL